MLACLHLCIKVFIKGPVVPDFVSLPIDSTRIAVNKLLWDIRTYLTPHHTCPKISTSHLTVMFRLNVAFNNF